MDDDVDLDVDVDVDADVDLHGNTSSINISHNKHSKNNIKNVSVMKSYPLKKPNTLRVYLSRKLATVYYNHGVFCANHPFPVLIIALFVMITLSLPAIIQLIISLSPDLTEKDFDLYSLINIIGNHQHISKLDLSTSSSSTSLTKLSPNQIMKTCSYWSNKLAMESNNTSKYTEINQVLFTLDSNYKGATFSNVIDNAILLSLFAFHSSVTSRLITPVFNNETNEQHYTHKLRGFKISSSNIENDDYSLISENSFKLNDICILDNKSSLSNNQQNEFASRSKLKSNLLNSNKCLTSTPFIPWSNNLTSFMSDDNTVSTLNNYFCLFDSTKSEIPLKKDLTKFQETMMIFLDPKFGPPPMNSLIGSSGMFLSYPINMKNSKLDETINETIIPNAMDFLIEDGLIALQETIIRSLSLSRFNDFSIPNIKNIINTLEEKYYNINHHNTSKVSVLDSTDNDINMDKNNTLTNETNLFTNMKRMINVAKIFFNDITSRGEFLVLLTSYLLVILYIALVMRNVDMVKSKSALAFSAIISVCFGLFMSIGICSFLEIRISLVPWEIFPFLIIVIGIDNVSIITRNVAKIPIDLPVKERIGRGLAKFCVNATFSLVGEVLLFLLISVVDIPLLQEFCFFGAIWIIVDYTIQLTFFVSVLSIDVRRLELSDLYTLKRKNSYVNYKNRFNYVDNKNRSGHSIHHSNNKNINRRNHNRSLYNSSLPPIATHTKFNNNYYKNYDDGSDYNSDIGLSPSSSVSNSATILNTRSSSDSYIQNSQLALTSNYNNVNNNNNVINRFNNNNDKSISLSQQHKEYDSKLNHNVARQRQNNHLHYQRQQFTSNGIKKTSLNNNVGRHNNFSVEHNDTDAESEDMYINSPFSGYSSSQESISVFSDNSNYKNNANTSFISNIKPTSKIDNNSDSRRSSDMINFEDNHYDKLMDISFSNDVFSDNDINENEYLGIEPHTALQSEDEDENNIVNSNETDKRYMRIWTIATITTLFFFGIATSGSIDIKNITLLHVPIYSVFFDTADNNILKDNVEMTHIETASPTTINKIESDSENSIDNEDFINETSIKNLTETLHISLRLHDVFISNIDRISLINKISDFKMNEKNNLDNSEIYRNKFKFVDKTYITDINCDEYFNNTEDKSLNLKDNIIKGNDGSHYSNKYRMYSIFFAIRSIGLLMILLKVMLLFTSTFVLLEQHLRKRYQNNKIKESLLKSLLRFFLMPFYNFFDFIHMYFTKNAGSDNYNTEKEINNINNEHHQNEKNKVELLNKENKVTKTLQELFTQLNNILLPSCISVSNTLLNSKIIKPNHETSMNIKLIKSIPLQYPSSDVNLTSTMATWIYKRDVGCDRIEYCLYNDGIVRLGFEKLTISMFKDKNIRITNLKTFEISYHNKKETISVFILFDGIKHYLISIKLYPSSIIFNIPLGKNESFTENVLITSMITKVRLNNKRRIHNDLDNEQPLVSLFTLFISDSLRKNIKSYTILIDKNIEHPTFIGQQDILLLESDTEEISFIKADNELSPMGNYNTLLIGFKSGYVRVLRIVGNQGLLDRCFTDENIRYPLVSNIDVLVSSNGPIDSKAFLIISSNDCLKVHDDDILYIYLSNICIDGRKLRVAVSYTKNFNISIFKFDHDNCSMILNTNYLADSVLYSKLVNDPIQSISLITNVETITPEANFSGDIIRNITIVYMVITTKMNTTEVIRIAIKQKEDFINCYLKEKLTRSIHSIVIKDKSSDKQLDIIRGYCIIYTKPRQPSKISSMKELMQSYIAPIEKKNENIKPLSDLEPLHIDRIRHPIKESLHFKLTNNNTSRIIMFSLKEIDSVIKKESIRSALEEVSENKGIFNKFDEFILEPMVRKIISQLFGDITLKTINDNQKVFDKNEDNVKFNNDKKRKKNVVKAFKEPELKLDCIGIEMSKLEFSELNILLNLKFLKESNFDPHNNSTSLMLTGNKDENILSNLNNSIEKSIIDILFQSSKILDEQYESQIISRLSLLDLFIENKCDDAETVKKLSQQVIREIKRRSLDIKKDYEDTNIKDISDVIMQFGSRGIKPVNTNNNLINSKKSFNVAQIAKVSSLVGDSLDLNDPTIALYTGNHLLIFGK